MLDLSVAGRAKKRRAYRLQKGPTEAQIQAAVIRWLQLRAWPGVVWFHVPNGGSRHKIEAARMRGQGVVPGVPDIILMHDGRSYALELKTGVGRVSTAQSAMQKRMRDAGVTVEVAYGVDAALSYLESWGLVRK
jgi:hypothetical protein